MPDLSAKTSKQLGTPTEDSTALMEQTLCNPAQMAAAVQRERERREAAGFTDSVQAVQPLEAPKLDGVEWEPNPERGDTETTTGWYLLDPRKWNGGGHRA